MREREKEKSEDKVSCGLLLRCTLDKHHKEQRVPETLQSAEAVCALSSGPA